MFVQSAETVKAHGGKRTDVAIYRQEFTDTTWKLAKMNLALRGIEADLGERSTDAFGADLHPDLRADFVLANGSVSSKSSGEGDIRRKLVEANLVDCIVALPDRLFFNTGIPVALWFVSKDRHGNGHRKRTGEVPFIDARKLGRMEDSAR